MNALQVMYRYRKEVIQVSTYNNDIKVQNLYDNLTTKQVAVQIIFALQLKILHVLGEQDTIEALPQIFFLQFLFCRSCLIFAMQDFTHEKNNHLSEFWQNWFSLSRLEENN